MIKEGVTLITVIVVITLIVIGYFYPDNPVEDFAERIFYDETGIDIDFSPEEECQDELDEMEIRDIDGRIKLMLKKGSQLMEVTSQQGSNIPSGS